MRRTLFALRTGFAEASAPVLSALSHEVADPVGGGQEVVITGLGLLGVSIVDFGGAGAAFAVDSDTQIRAVPPAHAIGVVNVTVTSPAGTSNALAFEYWSPAQLAGIDGYFDSRKGVALTGSEVDTWEEQSRLAAYSSLGTKPLLVSDVLGAGVPAVRFTDGLSAVSGTWRGLPSGSSRFWVAKYTSEDDTFDAYAGNLPLTVVGDGTGGVYTNAGMLGGQLAMTQYPPFWDGGVGVRNAAGLNDGVARLLGITHDASDDEVVAYVDGDRQGEAIDSTPYNTTYDGWSAVGGGYPTPGADGFVGDLGAVVVVDGVIASAELTKLAAWARQSFGAQPPPAFPLTLAPTAAYLEGDYDDTVGDGRWRARAGRPLLAQSSPGPVAVGGAPDFEASISWRLIEATLTNDGGWTVRGDHHFYAYVQTESIFGNSPSLWLNYGALADSGQFQGLHLRKDGAQFFAYVYEWDSAQRKAEVEITSIVDGGGAGPFAVQGKKEAGYLWVRVSADGFDSGWVQGDACGLNGTTTGKLVVGYPNYDGIVRAAMTWRRVLAAAESDALAAWIPT